jgi:hypothetical protein
MESNLQPTLKDRAEVVWQKERPKRAARFSKIANRINELRRKIEDTLGANLSINIQVGPDGRPVAVIENLRFVLASYSHIHRKSLLLISPCARCLTEAGSEVNSLAQLGQLLHYYATADNSSCSECIGMTDSELTPLRLALRGARRANP